MVVAVTESGGAIITSRGVEGEARPDTLFVLNPGEVQSARMGHSRRWVYRSFYFGQGVLEEVSRALGVTRMPNFSSSAISDSGLSAQFRSLHRSLERLSDLSEVREGLIQTFARMLERCNTSVRPIDAGPGDRARFRKVAAAVRAHRLDDLRLDELAAVADLNVFQLITVFNRLTGPTPHAYLAQPRLDYARSHLRNGMAIAEAAIAAGFYDQSALANHFRRSYAITPRQYAMAMRG